MTFPITGIFLISCLPTPAISRRINFATIITSALLWWLNGCAHHHAQEGRQFLEVPVENRARIAPADTVHQGIDEDNPWTL